MHCNISLFENLKKRDGAKDYEKKNIWLVFPLTDL